AACKPADRIILLPGADGVAGAVLVSSEGQQQRLDKAYTSLAKSDEGLAEQAVSEAEVKDQFGRLLDAQPKSVTSFTVKFVSGSATELTPEADAVIEQLIAEVEGRESAEIRLVGHTDSVGDLLKNDVLSQRRAQAVVDILAARGVDREVMEATGRGEREPAVARGDNVSEAANRRVDIRVR
ncbi:MAG: OmpA family protein, partial [Pseudomonadales bacterium]